MTPKTHPPELVEECLRWIAHETSERILRDHIAALESRIKELTEAGGELLNELDGEAFHVVGQVGAELLFETAGKFRAALKNCPLPQPPKTEAAQ